MNEFLEDAGIDIPLFISGTLVDQSGRTLSGQTGKGLRVDPAAKPMCVGLNCALGASAMAPFLKRLSDCAECFVHVYSNAGLPERWAATTTRRRTWRAEWCSRRTGGSTRDGRVLRLDAAAHQGDLRGLQGAPRPLPTLGPPRSGSRAWRTSRSARTRTTTAACPS